MTEDENGRIRRKVTFDENIDGNIDENEEDDDSGLDESGYDDDNDDELDGESSDDDDDRESSKKLSRKVLVYLSSMYLSYANLCIICKKFFGFLDTATEEPFCV